MPEAKPPPLKFRPDLPRDRSIGIGCIGAGFIMADCHLIAYRDNGLNPVAIAARSRDKAAAVARRHDIPGVHRDWEGVMDDPAVEVLDIAVPPDVQIDVIRDAVKRKGKVRGILAQKPLGVNYKQAKQIVTMCRKAGITLAVNQNMRWDQSVAACRDLLTRGDMGQPVLATIDMRAVPHWMPWQERQGWVTLRIMSIHHLDTFRFWFGDPVRIFASTRPDPRTAAKFRHTDGIALYILEYRNGLRCSSWDDVWAVPGIPKPDEPPPGSIGINWRVEGTQGLARGTIGWPSYPRRTPSTIEYATTSGAGGQRWVKPRWKDVWFPDAFVGPMAELLRALEEGREPSVNGEDNLKTMALVDAAYRSAKEHRAVELREVMK